MSIIHRVFLILMHQLQVFMINYYTKLFFINSLYTCIYWIKYEWDILIVTVLKYNSTHGISMYAQNYDVMIIYLCALIENKTGTSQINYIIITIWNISEYTKYQRKLCIFSIFLFKKRLHLLFQLTICNYITYSMIIRS